MMKNVIKVAISIVLIIIFGITYAYHVNAEKYNMAYLYGMGDYLSMVKNTEGALNEVSPSYFDIDIKGNLKLNPVDEKLVINMHKQGIKVVPFFSNHWDRELGRLALKNRAQVVTDMVSAIQKYDLDGVNIDLENLNENDRNDYIELAKLIREKLPKGKSLVISVAANPYDLAKGWQGSYDYENLAKYADHLMIMAYDEHYEGGEAGPVASIHFVEKSIIYALQKVAKEKVVLGIPLYGRYWREDSSYGGEAISLKKMNELKEKYETVVTYDKETESVKAKIKVKSSDVKPKIYGKEWNAGVYVVWYENEESIKAKLDIVSQYDIKGTGTWRLGMEEKSLWNVFKETLQDKLNRFKDVNDGYWANYAISFLKEKNWINGKKKDIFAPDDDLTRAEMATLICKMLALDTNLVEKSNYTDISDHWAKNNIEAISDLGIVNGYEDGSFGPDYFITRGEVAKIVCKVVELADFKKNHPQDFFEGGNTLFMDMNGDEWCYEYVKGLASRNILKGYPDGTFRANGKVTRAEIAQVIYNLWH